MQKSAKIKKENWNDPDIVDTQLNTPKYYNTNPLITEFIEQWKKKVWDCMNDYDQKVQKDQLEAMSQCLGEMEKSTKDFLEKWKKAHITDDE